MALTILHAATLAAVEAATSQQAQCEALIAPWAGGQITVRSMAGDTLLATLTCAAWQLNIGVTPARVTPGARLARTHVADGTPTRLVFRTGSTDIFEVSAGIGAGDAQFTASVADIRAERFASFLIQADGTLTPPPPPVPQLRLIKGTDVQIGQTTTGWAIENWGVLPAQATIVLPSSVTTSYTPQTVAAGATVAVPLTPSDIGNLTITLTSSTPSAVVADSPATLVVSPLPLPASGAITNISLNNRDDINPGNDPLLNPLHPARPPWEALATIGWAGDQLSEFCGALYCKDWGSSGRYAMWGAPGHSTGVEYPGFAAFNVTRRRWELMDAAPPVSYITQAEWDAGQPPSTRADRTWGEWTGGSTDWPVGFRRPGYNPPFGAHTRNNWVYLPAAVAGNARGEIVAAWHGTLGASGTAVPVQHIYDCDTGLWRRTANMRPGYGSSVGGMAFHQPQNVVIGFSIESSGTATAVDILDLATETWTRRSSVGSLSVRIDSSFIVCGDLFVYVDNTATAMTMSATRVSLAKAGTPSSWTPLTLSAASLPLKVGGSLPGMLSCQWARCPTNGHWYAVDRNAGSQTVWRLSKPAGVADSDTAGLLAGTWTITTETLAGTGLEPAQYDYGRLQWCDALQGFLWTGDLHTSAVQCIRPIGV